MTPLARLYLWLGTGLLVAGSLVVALVCVIWLYRRALDRYDARHRVEPASHPVDVRPVVEPTETLPIVDPPVDRPYINRPGGER